MSTPATGESVQMQPQPQQGMSMTSPTPVNDEVNQDQSMQNQPRLGLRGGGVVGDLSVQNATSYAWPNC
ncbi:MAG: hypothetical protein LQ352_005192 [Teloschistes flavicans]|nr:MAG: hypothetical protein LQ352_005192 [Teloschistes flavicans]